MAEDPLLEVQKKEGDPIDFTYYMVLSQKSTYHKWRHIGIKHHLVTDEDIAHFLLECYNKSAAVSSGGGGICATCQSLLQLCCVTCDKVTQTTPVAAADQVVVTLGKADSLEPPTVSEDTATVTTGNHQLASQDVKGDGGARSGMNLRTRRRRGPVSRGERRTSKRRKKASTQREDSPDHTMSAGHSNSADGEDQYLDDCFRPVAELSEAVAPKVELFDSQDVKLEDDLASSPWEHPDKDDTADSKENTIFALSQLPRAGRGRPRKYPIIPLECTVCHKKLATRVSVINHMKRKHPETKIPELYHSAPSPTKQSPAQGGRNRRKEKNEADKNNVDADVDGSAEEEDHPRNGRAPVSEAMKRLRKAELESLKCATCGAQFEHKRQMYTHRRLCLSKVCHLCGKSVKQLEMHLKRHTSARRFPCPHCPKSFLFRNYLEQHLLYHRDERPYCCEVCGARYREKTRLNAHIRTHTGSKPYKCQLCEAAFTRPRGLNDHMRVHTGEKPYRCQVCGRQFSSSGNLAAHRRKVHGLQPQVPNRMTRKLLVVESTGPGNAEGRVHMVVNSTASSSCDSGGSKSEAAGCGGGGGRGCEAVGSSAVVGGTSGGGGGGGGGVSTACVFPEKEVGFGVGDHGTVAHIVASVGGDGPPPPPPPVSELSSLVSSIPVSAEDYATSDSGAVLGASVLSASILCGGVPVSSGTFVTGAGVPVSAPLTTAVLPGPCVLTPQPTTTVSAGVSGCSEDSIGTSGLSACEPQAPVSTAVVPVTSVSSCVPPVSKCPF
ncbi:uncharacterized protein LOC143277940 [Babylonia areolata]|uniref:uncharacterized protein LOC143277940 n=1 Tax=Babylonia areolata TaxID=304850 RepID=UPI003FD08444